LTLGWPLFGVADSGELQAVMALTPPGVDEWAPSLVESYQELQQIMGPEAVVRFAPDGEWVEAQRPKDPHYYLGIIGTSTAAQGKGYGRMLLDRLHELSEGDFLSRGVGLDTDSEENVSLY
jgi:GNAT superfamily N-acetyltransferase